MQVTVIPRKRPPCPVSRIRRLVETILVREGTPRATALTVLITGDPQIRDLNARFRGKRRPTNVLAFSNETASGFPRESEEYLGDIAISMDRARVEARAEGITITSRVLRLVAHGVLHLLGFDHEDNEQARVMEGKEALYLESS